MINDPDLFRGERLEILRKNARLRKLINDLVDYDSPLELLAVDVSFWADCFKTDLDCELEEEDDDADTYAARQVVDKLREIARFATESADFITESIEKAKSGV